MIQLLTEHLLTLTELLTEQLLAEHLHGGRNMTVLFSFLLDSMVTIDWGEDPRVWLKVQDTVSGGRGVLFASFLHYSVETIQVSIFQHPR